MPKQSARSFSPEVVSISAARLRADRLCPRDQHSVAAHDDREGRHSLYRQPQRRACSVATIASRMPLIDDRTFVVVVVAARRDRHQGLPCAQGHARHSTRYRGEEFGRTLEPNSRLWAMRGLASKTFNAALSADAPAIKRRQADYAAEVSRRRTRGARRAERLSSDEVPVSRRG